MSKITCHRKKNHVIYWDKGCKHHDPEITGEYGNTQESLESRLNRIEEQIDLIRGFLNL